MNNPTLEDYLTAAQTIVMEAGQEPTPGQIAVAWVLRHRLVREHYFKQSTLWGVCHAPAQFSCWNNSPDRNLETVMALPYSDRRVLTALQIIIRVFLGIEPDFSRGADHYHADYIVKPSWAKQNKVTTHIGHHIFYRLAGDPA